MGDSKKVEMGGRREMRIKRKKAKVSEVECRGEAMRGELSGYFRYLTVA